MKISKPLIWTFIISIMITTFSTQIFAASEKELEYNPVEDSNFFMGLDEEGNIINMYTEDLEPEEAIGAPMALNDEEDQFVAYDKSADKVLETFDNQKDADAYLAARKTDPNIVLYNNNVTHNFNYGIVNFKTKGVKVNTTYYEEATNKYGYTNGHYGADAAFLGYTKDGDVRFKLAGVVGVVKKSDVQLVEYSQDLKLSRYQTSGDRLYHRVETDFINGSGGSSNVVGNRPSYLVNNKSYYSYDGHYFYETFTKMIDDYKKGTYANSVNPKDPFYNYYLYLSHRSESNVTAAQIDKYIKDFDADKKGSSKLLNTGKAFKENEAKYGINALLMLGVAINESAWGYSNIAQTKNNLFGHNAFDSDPSLAHGYPNPQYGIYIHASRFLSDGYLDPCDNVNTKGDGWIETTCMSTRQRIKDGQVANYSNRYSGSHFGDKKSGINVKYASDPYWGEKAASQAHVLESKINLKEKREVIGVITNVPSVEVRKEQNSKSTLLYKTERGPDYPLKIIDSVKGEKINGSDLWYKVQSDPVLDKTRSKLIQNTSSQINEYDMKNMYGYVHSSNIQIVHGGLPDPVPVYKKGDLNGDGTIDIIDMALLQSHVKNVKKLSGPALEAAKINNDNAIDIIDMAMMQSHVKKIKIIEGW